MLYEFADVTMAKVVNRAKAKKDFSVFMTINMNMFSLYKSRL